MLDRFPESRSGVEPYSRGWAWAEPGAVVVVLWEGRHMPPVEYYQHTSEYLHIHSHDPGVRGNTEAGKTPRSAERAAGAGEEQ